MTMETEEAVAIDWKSFVTQVLEHDLEKNVNYRRQKEATLRDFAAEPLVN